MGGRGGPHGGKGACCFGVGGNLHGGDTYAGAVSQVISQQHKPVCILERQGPQKDALYQGEDRSRSPEAKSQRENDRQTEGWRLAQTANGKLKITEKRGHSFLGSHGRTETG